MAIFKKAGRTLKRLKQDESGVAALSWALSITVILGAMGAAMDYAVLSSAKARSQSIADTTALAAAIYVKNNGRPPTGTGELTDGNHSAESLGYEYKDFVINGASGVNVNISYDDNAKEVTTMVTGKTNPILVQFLGKNDLDFGAVSVVSYLNIEDTFPASIALVLDNSGSMQFDDRLPQSYATAQYFDYSCYRSGSYVPCDYHSGHEHGTADPNAKIRLVGLKDSVLTFQQDLQNRLGVEDDSGRRTLRMGMLPYSSAVIAAGTQDMDWGYLAEGTDGGTTGIKGMQADGGTNSSPPMADAETWMAAEDAVHTAEATRTSTEDKEALKFVIFMTDGQNTVGGWTFIPETGTGMWHRRQSDGSYKSKDWPKDGYDEGTVRRTADVDTEAACTSMKADGVQIFTIGYALEDFGKFRVNGWADYDDDHLYEIKEEIQTSAYNLMTNCASSSEHFIKAADAGQLESAFDEIQNAIVEELIRLKS